ncbi:hypothetical protein BXZ70DRAFT_579582 [Cristinia sonorae]|uniref:SET domain-containing protein n=1 Tax=Cristinia sonorae TaxID=1940300 RepID=A0A8K0XKT6_9AGAR|nr:hypothetical protein BXZ70DRAFT_579582 [Cristinia sonorae]
MSFVDLQSARKKKENKSFVGAKSSNAETKPGNQDQSYFGSDGSSSSQQLSDAITAQLPAGLEVRADEYTGRGVHTKSHVQAGSVLISCRPRINIISTQHLDVYCSYCCERPQSNGVLKRCTRCRQVWYCNAACQNNDWSIHKSECAALQRWKSHAPSEHVSVPGDAVRCLGRIVWTMQKEGQDSSWVKEFNSMQSHRTSLPPSAVDSHAHLAHALVQYLGVSSPIELAPFGLSSAADLVDLISRFTTNTFTLTTSSLGPIGICVSPVMALVNHSCDPNAVMVFPHSSDSTVPRPNMQLIAIRDIKPNEQIFGSYVDVTLPKEIRQRELQETYNFRCKCSLCVRRDIWIDPRESVRCPKSCGGICPAPIDDDDLCRCDKCGAVVPATDSIVDARRVGQEAVDKATLVQDQDPAKAKQLTSNMIPILISTGLTPSSHPLLPLYRIHLELLVSTLGSQLNQETLDEAIRTSAKYNAGLSNVLTKGHPVRGVALSELGKLLAVDEPSPASPDSNPPPAAAFPPSGPARLRLAHETLVRALEELSIGFGKCNNGGELGQEVRRMILRLESEMKVWTQGVRNVMADTRAAAS